MNKTAFLLIFLLLYGCNENKPVSIDTTVEIVSIETNTIEPTVTLHPINLPTETPAYPCRFGRQLQESVDPTLTIHLPILMYHQIVSFTPAGIADNPSLFVSAAEFEKQMTYLISEGYHSVYFSDLIDYKQNNCLLPEKPIIITFDDGWLEDYSVVFPILQRLDMVGTFFPPTSWVDHEAGGLLSWEQISEMSIGGMEFGSHTTSHVWLDRISDEQILNEITISKQLIQEHTGKPVIVLAYPGGAYSDRVIALLFENGYQAAVTTIYGIDQDLTEMFTLHRIGIRYDDSIAFFASRLR
jgi:peptidoglycan/xylan/chitin deacetylase (PgdA/CDA1 family)